MRASVPECKADRADYYLDYTISKGKSWYEEKDGRYCIMYVLASRTI
jgi:hypothetical protein